jgi:hypothetical protein
MTTAGIVEIQAIRTDTETVVIIFENEVRSLSNLWG